MPQVIRLAGLVDRLADRAMAVEIELDQMLARLDAQSLREAIEIVDRSGEIPVDIHLGVPGRHLNPCRAAAVIRAGIPAASPRAPTIRRSRTDRRRAIATAAEHGRTTRTWPRPRSAHASDGTSIRASAHTPIARETTNRGHWETSDRRASVDKQVERQGAERERRAIFPVRPTRLSAKGIQESG